MRKQVTNGSLKVWLSADDTYNWAHSPDSLWPCSVLSGKRVFAEFDSNGLVDVSIDGNRSADQDCPADEFNALIGDLVHGLSIKPE